MIFLGKHNLSYYLTTNHQLSLCNLNSKTRETNFSFLNLNISPRVSFLMQIFRETTKNNVGSFEKQIIFNCLRKSSVEAISTRNKLPSVGGKTSRGKKGKIFLLQFCEKCLRKTFIMKGNCRCIVVKNDINVNKEMKNSSLLVPVVRLLSSQS